MRHWGRSSGPLAERPMLAGGLICTVAISAGLFARGDHRKGAATVAIWGPFFVNLADKLSERIKN